MLPILATGESQQTVAIARALAIGIKGDGGKWSSKYHHLVVIKIFKKVDYFLKNVEKW